MGWKEALGISSFVGAKRELAELKFEKQEIEHAIEVKDHGWEATGKRLDYVNKQIAEYEEKVSKEDSD